MNNYDDIINLKYPIEQKKITPNRIAQFLPFSALTGYNEALKEIEKVTTEKIILDEEENKILDYKLEYLSTNLDLNVSITYFVKDIKLEGGNYNTINNKIKKIDKINKKIILKDNTNILISDIININILDSPFN